MKFADTATGFMMGGSGPNVIRYFGDVTTTTDTTVANGQPSSGVSLSENVASNFSIYPNPTKQYVDVAGITVNRAYLYNLQGAKIELPAAIHNRIDLSRVNSGMYILIIEDDQKQIFNHKLMVQ